MGILLPATSSRLGDPGMASGTSSVSHVKVLQTLAEMATESSGDMGQYRLHSGGLLSERSGLS